MGSLPNLHELSAGYAHLDWPNEIFGKAFVKSGEMAGAKGHHKTVAQTRSLGADPNACVGDAPSSAGRLARAGVSEP